MFLQFLFVLVHLKCILSKESQLSFTVEDINNFPHKMENNFTIIIRESNYREVFKNVMDVMVIQIKGGQGGLKEEYVDFQVGFRSSVRVVKQLFEVVDWIKVDNNVRVIATLRFKEEAHGAQMKMYFLSVEKASEYEKRLSHVDRFGEEILNVKIDLLVKPIVTLTVTGNNAQPDSGIDPGTEGVIECTVKGGRPLNQRPFFRSIELEGQATRFYGPVDNRIETTFTAQVIDHNKIVACYAGEAQAVTTIKVHHPPTQLLLDPEILSDRNNLIPNGSSIVCSAIDGYTWPVISWNIVYAPYNATNYYFISPKLRKFTLRPSAPLGSMWSINCTAINPKGSYNRTIQFRVGNSNKGLFGSYLMMQIVVGVAVAGAITLFCVFIVLILCVARRGCGAGPGANSSGRNNGVAVQKQPAERKNMEPEQVTLLPPGVPQNHIIMQSREQEEADVGVMPPPPLTEPIPTHIVTPLEPSSDTMNSGDSNSHNQFHHSPSESYRQEVTYAELSGTQVTSGDSTMPIRGGQDDQATHFQTVGTASPGAAIV